MPLRRSLSLLVEPLTSDIDDMDCASLSLELSADILPTTDESLGGIDNGRPAS